MTAELESHLQEAQAAGKPPESVVGKRAHRLRRGMGFGVPVPPPATRRSHPRRDANTASKTSGKRGDGWCPSWQPSSYSSHLDPRRTPWTIPVCGNGYGWDSPCCWPSARCSPPASSCCRLQSAPPWQPPRLLRCCRPDPVPRIPGYSILALGSAATLRRQRPRTVVSGRRQAIRRSRGTGARRHRSGPRRGRVKLDAEEWNATTNGEKIAAGVKVKVVQVRGTRLVVEKAGPGPDQIDL